jgi:hypothetical protein
MSKNDRIVCSNFKCNKANNKYSMLFIKEEAAIKVAV